MWPPQPERLLPAPVGPLQPPAGTPESPEALPRAPGHSQEPRGTPEQERPADAPAVRTAYRR